MTTKNKMHVNTNLQRGPHNWEATIQTMPFQMNELKYVVTTNQQKGPRRQHF